MKFFKTLLLSIGLLLFCSIGVMAADQITVNYINKEGKVEQTSATPITESSTELTFTTSGNWYFAGQTTSGETPNAASASDVKFSATPGTGEINIIVGSNGAEGTVAMTITNQSGWQLGNDQTINIYAAANNSNTTNNNITSNISNCFLTLYNTNNSAEEEPEEMALVANPTSAITLNGGNLNVYSGVAFAPTALGAPGLTVTSGNVTVAAGGQLQPTYNLTSATTTPEVELENAQASSSTYGLSIAASNATLNNAGYLKVVQNITDSTWDYAGIETTNGAGIAKDSGGTIQTSTPYNTSFNFTKGIWIESFGNTNNTSGVSNPINATTNNINAFGTVSLYTGFKAAMNLTGNNTLTVNGNNTELIIPNDYDLTFGTASSGSSPDGKLVVSAGGTLIIDSNADVTMNANSVLENNGTITVNPVS